MEHLTYTDSEKSIADIGWWEQHDANERRFVFTLHGATSSVRYALINTGDDWLLHRVKGQPAVFLTDPEQIRAYTHLAGMSVKYAIARFGSRRSRIPYGVDLRAEFENRTAATWPLNVGQVSTTLERLELATDWSRWRAWMRSKVTTRTSWSRSDADELVAVVGYPLPGRAGHATSRRSSSRSLSRSPASTSVPWSRPSAGRRHDARVAGLHPIERSPHAKWVPRDLAW